MLNVREFVLTAAIVLALSWWCVDQQVLYAVTEAFR